MKKIELKEYYDKLIEYGNRVIDNKIEDKQNAYLCNQEIKEMAYSKSAQDISATVMELIDALLKYTGCIIKDEMDEIDRSRMAVYLYTEKVVVKRSKIGV